MNTFLRTGEFDAWLVGLKTRWVWRASSSASALPNTATSVIVQRWVRVFPKCASFARRGEVVYLLLLGGDKSSQKRDIKRAIAMAQSLDKK